MLAYQHAYHAGNFADVHKHLGLFRLAEALRHKTSAISFIDTHAGRGLYPLTAKETQKLGEYRDGVERVWRGRRTCPPGSPLGDWLASLEALQNGDELVQYPGSPWWLSKALRPQDRLTLFELHPGEHRYLADQAMPPTANVIRRHADGLKGLRRLLPVSTPRICVIIDPSYERKDEYDDVAETLEFLARKARHAVFVLWYPLLPAGRHRAMLERLRGAGIDKLWRSELVLHEPAAERGLYGSGLLIGNPPWQLDESLDHAFTDLASRLGDVATHRDEWLTKGA